MDVNSTFIWWLAASNLKFDIFPSTNIGLRGVMLKINGSRFASQSVLDNFPYAFLIFKATEYIRTQRT